jgi:hypothetical protein
MHQQRRHQAAIIVTADTAPFDPYRRTEGNQNEYFLLIVFKTNIMIVRKIYFGQILLTTLKKN